MTMIDTGSETPGPEAPALDANDDAPEAAGEVAVPLGAWPEGVDHKVVGKLFLLLAFVFLVAGGVLALVMRSQLAAPDLDVVGNRTYRQLFTMHGVFMVFLFLLPAWIGLASVMVPLQIGAARLAFPRVQALSLWLFVAGGGMIVAAPLVSDVISGWALSSPIPQGRGFRGDGPDLLILGLAVVLVAAVAAAVNLIVTVLKFRAPALTLRRTPMFSWSVLVSSSVLLLALPVLISALMMLFVDRHYGGKVFNGFTGSRGGNPLLWPRLFWFGAYPALWALLLPALGVVAEIVQVFGRQRLVGRHRAMAAMAGIGVLAFAGWGSEVSNLASARLLFALGALAVLAPLSSVVMSWLVTLVAARRSETAGVDAGRPTAETARTELRQRMANPAVLHALGLVTVLGAGMFGAVFSALNASGRLHRNYWAVAEQHTLFFGASTVGLVAGLYYWAPKLWGRHLSPRLGALQAVTLVAGVHLTFLPMYVLGLQNMRTHVATYPTHDEWQPANLVSTIGAFVLAMGVLMLVANLAGSRLRGRPADPDPWGGHTLEWATASPPPPHNFDSLPEVRSEAPLLDVRAATEPAEAQAVR